MTASSTSQPNNLEAFWMPFTANRQFKQTPRMLVSRRGHALHDAATAARCSTVPRGCGASTPATAASKIAEAVQRAGCTSWITRRPSRWAIRRRSSSRSRLVDLAPGDLDHVFFTNSGSESVDTALKIALAYHRVPGEGARSG